MRGFVASGAPTVKGRVRYYGLPGERSGSLIDMHIHTWRCRHAVGTVDEYVRAAVARDIRTMAFTEHLPLNRGLTDRIPGATAYAMPSEELPEYLAEVRDAVALGEELGVEVLLGVEVDLDVLSMPGARETVSQLENADLDLVLGSVHFIDDWAFDDPARTERYDEWRIEDLWDRYFTDVIAVASAGIVDVIAHADLVKKFTRAPAGRAPQLYREAAAAFAEAGVVVEINSAGLRKPCAEVYPSPGFLNELRAAGVPVTIGSDAHAPTEVGVGLDVAVAAAREAGYRSVSVFRQRIREEVPIDAL